MAKTYPIILAHGIARFDVLSNGLLKIDNDANDDRIHYFRNIRTHLMNAQFHVRHSNVDWAGSLVKRAADLKEEVEKTLQLFAAENVHIIGHSMGGLDARRMLFDFRDEGFHDKIASLTTIGVPHHGTCFAQFLIDHFGDAIEELGMAVAGLKDLTPQAVAKLNAELEDFEADCGVRFRTYAGQQAPVHIFTPLKLSWSIINKSEGPNDGFVSVASARWKDEYFVPPVWDADHLNQICWWDLSELWQGVEPHELEERIKGEYLKIAEDLAEAFPLD